VAAFVDDVVLGSLPPVCAKTGAPSDGRAPASATVGGPSVWALLLVLLGPVGWLALLVMALLGGGGETLHGWIPMTEAAFERVLARRRAVKVALAVSVAGAVALVAGARVGLSPLPSLVVVIGGLVGAAFASFAADRAHVSLRLDGSRRWVAIDGVHPAFAAAVEEQQRRERSVSQP
jgi:hypothetical protein